MRILVFSIALFLGFVPTAQAQVPTTAQADAAIALAVNGCVSNPTDCNRLMTNLATFILAGNPRFPDRGAGVPLDVRTQIVGHLQRTARALMDAYTANRDSLIASGANREIGLGLRGLGNNLGGYMNETDDVLGQINPATGQVFQFTPLDNIQRVIQVGGAFDSDDDASFVPASPA